MGQSDKNLEHVGPDKRCAQCRGFIIGDPVWVKVATGAVEVCSSDCAIDLYQARKGGRREHERRAGPQA